MTTKDKIWEILTEYGSQYDNLSPDELKKLCNDIRYVIGRLQIDRVLAQEPYGGNVISLTRYRINRNLANNLQSYLPLPLMITNPF